MLVYVGTDQFVHFCNILSDGVVHDLASPQFSQLARLKFVKIMTCAELHDFGEVFPEMARRYELLSWCLKKSLEEERFKRFSLF